MPSGRKYEKWWEKKKANVGEELKKENIKTNS
jgi:hypothetical protein